MKTVNITDYQSANEYLSKGRNKNDRPLPGNGTRLVRVDSRTIAVSYHGTHVVTYFENGMYAFDRGGWLSDTTWRRIEEYSPISIAAGAVLTQWSYHRQYVRRGPDTWVLRMMDGTEHDIADGKMIDIFNPRKRVAA